MRRWGQIGPRPRTDALVRRDCEARSIKPDIYLGRPPTLLIEEGKLDASELPDHRRLQAAHERAFIDGVVYDGKKPNEYLSKFAIGLQAEAGTAETARVQSN